MGGKINTYMVLVAGGRGSNMLQGDCLKTEVYLEDNNAKMDLEEVGWRPWT